MPSGLPRVLKPVKKDNNLFSSLLTSRYKKRQPSSKLDEIQEFIELVQLTNMKGIVSSSCYVDPLYYFGRLCGVKQPPKMFIYKNERKEGGKKKLLYLILKVVILPRQEGKKVGQ
ncbi:hypothetical protein NC652_031893 [Populus alba x Populus x berolinensis]|nr:hypothetical protein NC652_031893 [Populus alba x Populus x berolinensis]